MTVSYVGFAVNLPYNLNFFDFPLRKQQHKISCKHIGPALAIAALCNRDIYRGSIAFLWGKCIRLLSKPMARPFDVSTSC